MIQYNQMPFDEGVKHLVTTEGLAGKGVGDDKIFERNAGQALY